jgi:hypothetical protein
MINFSARASQVLLRIQKDGNSEVATNHGARKQSGIVHGEGSHKCGN